MKNGTATSWTKSTAIASMRAVRTKPRRLWREFWMGPGGTGASGSGPEFGGVGTRVIAGFDADRPARLWRVSDAW
jgi:hypothetical protein